MDEEYKDICPYCKAERRFDPWVFAHWNERLVTTCPQCGKQYAACRGITMKMKQKKERTA